MKVKELVPLDHHTHKKSTPSLGSPLACSVSVKFTELKRKIFLFSFTSYHAHFPPSMNEPSTPDEQEELRLPSVILDGVKMINNSD